MKLQAAKQSILPLYLVNKLKSEDRVFIELHSANHNMLPFEQAALDSEAQEQNRASAAFVETAGLFAEEGINATLPVGGGEPLTDEIAAAAAEIASDVAAEVVSEGVGSTIVEGIGNAVAGVISGIFDGL